MIFDLTYSYIIEEDGECNVYLKPSSDQISDYIGTYKSYASESEAILDMDDYIAEMKPILFYQFKDMSNIPEDIRNNFNLE